LHFEGGWTNNPNDPGGPTMKGVTLKVYKAWCAANGLPEPDETALHNIPDAHLDAIFKGSYWDRISGDSLPPGLDLAMADMGYNAGPGAATKLLRGVLGLGASSAPLTEQELAHIWSISDQHGLCSAYCDARLAFLQGLHGGILWQHFGKGWANRVAGIKAMSIHLCPSDFPTYVAQLQTVGHASAFILASPLTGGKAEEAAA